MIRLGIIGMSPGNGHPYSWSAICNGYNKEKMATCPFPVIPEYLEKQFWPDAQLQSARVTHIWTQDEHLSREIAGASLIPNVAMNMLDMIGEVDAILLARDDSENHERFATPFLNAGLPIFIDKPLSTTMIQAENLLGRQKFPNQIFSCSALRYSDAFIPSNIDLADVKSIHAKIPKYWRTYAVHLIEPVVANFRNKGKLFEIRKNGLSKQGTSVTAYWENLTATFETTDSTSGKFEVTFLAEVEVEIKNKIDSFAAFKLALQNFIIGIASSQIVIPREETMEVIQIIEHGCK